MLFLSLHVWDDKIWQQFSFVKLFKYSSSSYRVAVQVKWTCLYILQETTMTRETLIIAIYFIETNWTQMHFMPIKNDDCHSEKYDADTS